MQQYRTKWTRRLENYERRIEYKKFIINIPMCATKNINWLC